MFKDFLKNASTEAKITVFSVFAILALILIISIVNLLNQPKPYTEPQHVNISNWSDHINAPDDLKTNLEHQIWAVIKDENGVDQSNIIEAKIRDNTTAYTDNYTIALIDIDSLHYTFRSNITYNENKLDQPYYNPGTSIACPYPLDVIYTDKKCPIGTPLEQLKTHLPHEATIYGTKLTSELRPYDEGTPPAGYELYLSVQIAACGNQNILNLSKQHITSWIKSLYLDPNDYRVVVYDTCK